MPSYEIVVISSDKPFLSRCEALASSFEFKHMSIVLGDLIIDEHQNWGSPELFIIDGRIESVDSTISSVQTAKQFFPEATIMTVLGTKSSPENTEFMKKSGARAVLLELEFFSTSKPEYICSQSVRANYLAIRGEDLIEGSTLECGLKHFMPMNKKFIPVVQPGQAIGKEKIDKIKAVGDVYFEKKDLSKVNQYIQSSSQGAELSPDVKGRNLFLNLGVAYSNLVLGISDQSSAVSFADGKELLAKCQGLSEEVLKVLAQSKNPWDVLYNVNMGSLGVVDRSPIVAAFAGLLSLRSQVGNPGDTLFAALMADLGLLEMSPASLLKVRKGKVHELNPEEKSEYEKHPIFSLNLLLSRKIQLSDAVKNIIVSTHEQADSQGFPHKPRPEKIPDEALIIQFCAAFDSGYVNIPKQARPTLEVQKNEMLKREFQNSNKLGEHFLRRIQASFLGQG